MASPRRPSNTEAYIVGDIVQSVLSEPAFVALRGNTWVLMDGRSIVGSKLAEITGWSNLPDARGQFLRGKNNNRSDGNQDPDGERSIGHFQGDAIRNITGGARVSTFQGGNSMISATGAFTNGSNFNSSFAGGGGGANTGTTYTFNASSVVPTANDNRPKNIAVNIFIKIN